jgi:nicotinate-nucleotide adenylyltransferase
LIVYPRPNTTKSELLDHEHVTIVKAPLIDISASQIRDLIKKGKSVKYLVPEAVEKYMDKKNLYR